MTGMQSWKEPHIWYVLDMYRRSAKATYRTRKEAQEAIYKSLKAAYPSDTYYLRGESSIKYCLTNFATRKEYADGVPHEVTYSPDGPIVPAPRPNLTPAPVQEQGYGRRLPSHQATLHRPASIQVLTTGVPSRQGILAHAEHANQIGISPILHGAEVPPQNRDESLSPRAYDVNNFTENELVVGQPTIASPTMKNYSHVRIRSDVGPKGLADTQAVWPSVLSPSSPSATGFSLHHHHHHQQQQHFDTTSDEIAQNFLSFDDIFDWEKYSADFSTSQVENMDNSHAIDGIPPQMLANTFDQPQYPTRQLNTQSMMVQPPNMFPAPHHNFAGSFPNGATQQQFAQLPPNTQPIAAAAPNSGNWVGNSYMMSPNPYQNRNISTSSNQVGSSPMMAQNLYQSPHMPNTMQNPNMMYTEHPHQTRNQSTNKSPRGHQHTQVATHFHSDGTAGHLTRNENLLPGTVLVPPNTDEPTSSAPPKKKKRTPKSSAQTTSATNSGVKKTMEKTPNIAQNRRAANLQKMGPSFGHDGASTPTQPNHSNSVLPSPPISQETSSTPGDFQEEYQLQPRHDQLSTEQQMEIEQLGHDYANSFEIFTQPRATSPVPHQQLPPSPASYDWNGEVPHSSTRAYMEHLNEVNKQMGLPPVFPSLETSQPTFSDTIPTSFH